MVLWCDEILMIEIHIAALTLLLGGGDVSSKYRCSINISRVQSCNSQFHYYYHIPVRYTQLQLNQEQLFVCVSERYKYSSLGFKFESIIASPLFISFHA
jgi:hypothetical protein